MDFGLRDKTALVFGAGSGLGAAIARELAAEGAKVALAGRRIDALERTSQSIAAAGGQACVIGWDLSDLDVIESRFATIERSLGRVDILVNNTGGPPPSTAEGQSAEVWRTQFDAMVLPVIKITDRALPHMREQRWGRILTTTSSGVVSPIPALAMSNTLRAALVNWSKTLATEVAKHGITANILVPGKILTDRLRFLDEFTAGKKDLPVQSVVDSNEGAIPAKRYGTPEEYAAAAAFLASARASYITGTILRVDGGAIASI